MKILVDANLSPIVAERLTEGGYEAAHVRDHDLLAASDDEITGFATGNGWVILSADSDFASILAFSGRVAPSLILMRSADKLAPAEQAAILLANLPAVIPGLEKGAVVTIARGHLRVRRLPLRQ
ncbi:MAG: DUF5615 family PIN-like protein [Micromonosporaceae bacterium]